MDVATSSDFYLHQSLHFGLPACGLTPCLDAAYAKSVTDRQERAAFADKAPMRGDPIQPQQPGFPVSCTGGQGTEPNEQNTQQSPAFGRSVAPQPGQSKNTTQAFSGMASSA